MTCVDLLPIFSIKRPEDVFGHLCLTSMAKRIGALDYPVSFLNQFFVSHCLLAAAFCTRADSALPQPKRITLYGDANGSSMSPLLLTPECGREWLQYLFAQPTWPAIRSILASPLWFGTENPFSAWRTGPGTQTPPPVYKLNQIPFNEPMDILVHLPSHDMLETLDLDLPQHAWSTCLDRQIPVRLITASMTEALLLREYATIHGFFLSSPSALPIKANINENIALAPAGYVLDLIGPITEQDASAKERFNRLHSAIQSTDGYYDDDLLTGTRTADGNGIYMFHSCQLNLQDGYLYQIMPSIGDEADSKWVRVAGPLDFNNDDFQIPIMSNPVDRWYWALNIVENLEPVEERDDF